VAALHLGAFEPDLVPAIATIAGVSSYSSIASSEYYDTPTFIEVPGVLKHYDLPDLMAAYALPVPSARSALPREDARATRKGRSVLILGPTDAMTASLDETAAKQAFDFPTKFFAKVQSKQSGAAWRNMTAQFVVQAGDFLATDAAAAVAAWVQSLP
jgi:hypothetical protein